jgi:hypothetical protein
MGGISIIGRKHRWPFKEQSPMGRTFTYGQCEACKKEGKRIFSQGLCFYCYEYRQVNRKLIKLENKFIPASDYNKYLFTLYLTYIRRYWMRYWHAKQAKKLKTLLERKPWDTILSWVQIFKLSDQYKLMRPGYTHKGCAIIRIGFMLEELGVLPPRETERGHHVERALRAFNGEDLEVIRSFLQMLKKDNVAKATNLIYLGIFRNFSCWLKENYPQATLITANHTMVKKYLDFLCLQKTDAHRIRATYYNLNRFYRFCRFKKLVLVNPCDNIKASPKQVKLYTCSQELFRKIQHYIKNPKSDPESALLLCLVLFLGFTSEDLRYAKIVQKHNTFDIAMRRKPLSKGIHYYNRDQVVKLPIAPHWFLDLQRRYYQVWLDHYNRIKRTYPHEFLLLPYDHNQSRSLSSCVIRQRMKKATKLATGKEIPIRSLRNTCAYVYILNQDASMLSRIGWATDTAFRHTYLTRIFISPEENNSKIK